MVNTAQREGSIDKRYYWEQVYADRSLTSSGWYQPIPQTSLNLIASAKIQKKAHIIDVGGGDSLLVDHLLSLGYENLTVLDISKKAIDRAKKRLGVLAENVTWICEDITRFRNDISYDLWHDRACLHFLTEFNDQKLYRQKAADHLAEEGVMIIGAFSKTGPEKCSGLPISQYNQEELSELFSQKFRLKESSETIHITPSNTVQNYVFCIFKRK